MTTIIYIHGKGGNAQECEHYRPLFPGCEVIGLDYKGNTPWDAGREIAAAVRVAKKRSEKVYLIANSIGAFFSMYSGAEADIAGACFISPIVDMENLIAWLMGQAGVTEEELRTRGVIPTAFGEDLSWEYLSYVRAYPIVWRAPTAILYGSGDTITPCSVMRGFADKIGAKLTVMEGGEHWFHTEEQMRFLDEWITGCLPAERIE